MLAVMIHHSALLPVASAPFYHRLVSQRGFCDLGFHNLHVNDAY